MLVEAQNVFMDMQSTVVASVPCQGLALASQKIVFAALPFLNVCRLLIVSVTSYVGAPCPAPLGSWCNVSCGCFDNTCDVTMVNCDSIQ